MRTETKVILSVFLFLFCSSIVAGEADLEPHRASASPDNPAHFELDLWGEQGNYSFGGEGPGELVAAPSEVRVERSNNQTINLWFRPYRSTEPGNYRIEIFMEGEENTSSFNPLVKVENDHRIGLKVEDSTCEGNSTVILENKGFHREEVSISGTGVEEHSYVIDPGVRKKFNLSLQGSVLEASSETSYAFDSAQVDLNCSKPVSQGQFFTSPSGVAGSVFVLLVVLVAVLEYRRGLGIREFVGRYT